MGFSASARPGSRRSSPARGGLWGVLLGALLGAATGASCAFPLEQGIACGDGYWDAEAGEECDPADPKSYQDGCKETDRPQGEAACDPVSCTIINTISQCGKCGDGEADTLLGEQCDGQDLRGELCPGGVGTLRCNDSCEYDTTYCKRCGNGVVDPGEECDPNADPDALTQGKPMCDELVSPYLDGRPYTSGQPGSCLEDCRWDREGCGYCGNGRVEDDEIFVDLDGTMAIEEWCDGNAFSAAVLEEQLADSLCTSANPELRPIVECASNCLDFVPVDDPEPCCVKTGGTCPLEGVPLRCCFEVDQPDATQDPCQVVFDSFGNVVELCR